jgi:hypothetical protein
MNMQRRPPASRADKVGAANARAPLDELPVELPDDPASAAVTVWTAAELLAAEPDEVTTLADATVAEVELEVDVVVVFAVETLSVLLLTTAAASEALGITVDAVVEAALDASAAKPTAAGE